jgi:predicted dehydrogenase
MKRKINAALVGLGFGGAFAGIYKEHPNIETVGLFDTNKDISKRASEYSGISKIYESFDEILNDKNIDAVHLVTPIPLHEEQTVQVLESGKHCACTVPMAISLDGIRRITEAARKSGKNYMMMETTLYTYQYFYVKELIKLGKIGKIQFLRGSHYQEMVNWPD